jgi:ABC-type Mn2+/Zn2+ transport system ATPase subunit
LTKQDQEALPSKSMLIQAESLSVGYSKDQPIVKDIHLTIESGKNYALTGGNGSGKTTLFKTLTGLLPAISGNLKIECKKSISYVPQSKKLQLHFPLSVKEVLSMPYKSIFPFSDNITHSVWWEELIALSELEPILSKQISECSGGQLQKVLITRALLSGAQLVFLDEPMDALDHQARKSFQEILAIYRQRMQASLFFITHNLDYDWKEGFAEVFEIDQGHFFHLSKGDKPNDCEHYDGSN